jgi:uncharacterized membrane protein
MNAWTDERVEWVIGTLLRWGVVLAAVVVLAGGALYLALEGSTIPDYGIFHGESADLRAAVAIAREAFSLRPVGLIQFGLLMLIATPVARVALSVVVFVLKKDTVYIFVTLFVLSVLAFSLARVAP